MSLAEYVQGAIVTGISLNPGNWMVGIFFLQAAHANKQTFRRFRLQVSMQIADPTPISFFAVSHCEADSRAGCVQCVYGATLMVYYSYTQRPPVAKSWIRLFRLSTVTIHRYPRFVEGAPF